MSEITTLVGRLVVSITLATTFIVSFAVHAAQERLIINYRGTGTAVPKVVPDSLGVGPNANGLLNANCFEAEIFDLQSGELLGTAEDCLSELAVGTETTSGSGVQVVGTTVFNLASGRLIVQGLTSVQPVNWPTNNSDVVFTHITGANSPANAVLTGTGEFASTGEFANATARVRLSGQVDLSQVADGTITFDCIFVVDIDRPGVTGRRYDDTQGEIFWTRNSNFNEYNIYRDDILVATSDGTSFYQSSLVDGVSYRYQVKAVTSNGQVDIGDVTLPGSTGPGTNQP